MSVLTFQAILPEYKILETPAPSSEQPIVTDNFNLPCVDPPMK